METKLMTTSCYNPFFVHGKEVRRIVFYGDGKEIASVNWFGSNNVYKSITLPFEVKRALKVNLDRRDAFYVKSKPDYPYGPEYDLYIFGELLGLKFLKTAEFKSWSDIRHNDVYQVNLHGVRKNYVRNERGEAVRIEQDGDYEETFSCNYTFENTEEYDKCEELANKLNKLCTKNLSAHDIHYILEKFDITEKQ